MAIQHALLTIGVHDDTGVPTTFNDYISFDNGTATLSSLAAAVSAEVGAFDDLTEAVVDYVTLTLNYALPAGMKTDPVAGSDVEETGLINFTTTSEDGRTYSQDIPAILQSLLVGKNINLAGPNAASAWVTLVTTVGTFTSLDDRYAFRLVSARSGEKTFRKKRRALKRA